MPIIQRGTVLKKKRPMPMGTPVQDKPSVLYSPGYSGTGQQLVGNQPGIPDMNVKASMPAATGMQTQQMVPGATQGRPLTGGTIQATPAGGGWSSARPQADLMARAAAAKASGLPAHSGVGVAMKRLQAARAAGQTNTGAGMRLRKKLRSAMHPDAKTPNWY